MCRIRGAVTSLKNKIRGGGKSVGRWEHSENVSAVVDGNLGRGVTTDR